MINKNYEIYYNSHPFPYIKIKNFFDKNFFKELEDGFPSLDQFKNSKSSFKRMHYDITYGDFLYNQLITNNKAYRKFHDYIYSNQFIDLCINFFLKDINHEIKKNFLDQNVLNYRKITYYADLENSNAVLHKNSKAFLYPRFDIGTGLKGYGISTGGGGVHVDNQQRLISGLFYVGGYQKILGGEHRIWKKTKDKKKIEIHEVIEPEKNLMILALQNNIAFHDVNPVNSIDGTRNAFYLAVSSSKSVWAKVKNSSFNRKYNKNRVKNNFIFQFFQKLKRKIFKHAN